MKIRTSDTRKFHKLYLQTVGISLSDDEARRKLNKLLRQVELLVNEDEKKMKDLDVRQQIKTPVSE